MAIYQHRTARPSWLWDSYLGVDPAATAVIFKRAAELVAHDGHNAYNGSGDHCDPDPGISIEAALRAAASAHLDREEFGYQRAWEVGELVDELLNRLAAVLYLLGQVRGTPLGHMSGVPFSWESNPAEWYPKPAYHDAADIVRVLNLASAMIELVHATWPATAPAADQPANHPVWVKLCNQPGCVLTIEHRHGMSETEFAAFCAADDAAR